MLEDLGLLSGTRVKMLCLIGVVIWFWGLLESLPRLLNELQAGERERERKKKPKVVKLRKNTCG